MKNKILYWTFIISACGLLAIGRLYDVRLSFYGINLVSILSILYFFSCSYLVFSTRNIVFTKTKFLLYFFYLSVVIVTPILWLFFGVKEFGYMNYINFIFIIIPISFVVIERFDRQDILNMLYVLLSVVLFLALLSSIGLSISDRPDGRLATLGGGPIVFARWMGLGIISLILLPLEINNKYKFFLILLFLLMALSSGSRGPILSLIVTSLVYIILNFNKLFIKFSLLLGVFVLIFLSTNLSSELSNLGKFDRVFMNVSTKGGSLKSTSTRAKFVTSSLIMIKNYPLGVGSGNWQPISNELRPNNLTPDDLQYPHNIFLEVACEYGVISLILILLLFVYVFYLSYIKMKKYNKHKTSLYTALFYLLIFLSFNSLLSGMLNDSRLLFLVMSFIIVSKPLIKIKEC